jgi:hypothetical protein
VKRGGAKEGVYIASQHIWTRRHSIWCSMYTFDTDEAFGFVVSQFRKHIVYYSYDSRATVHSSSPCFSPEFFWQIRGTGRQRPSSLSNIILALRSRKGFYRGKEAKSKRRFVYLSQPSQTPEKSIKCLIFPFLHSSTGRLNSSSVNNIPPVVFNLRKEQSPTPPPSLLSLFSSKKGEPSL